MSHYVTCWASCFSLSWPAWGALESSPRWKRQSNRLSSQVCCILINLFCILYTSFIFSMLFRCLKDKAPISCMPSCRKISWQLGLKFASARFYDIRMQLKYQLRIPIMDRSTARIMNTLSDTVDQWTPGAVRWEITSFPALWCAVHSVVHLWIPMRSFLSACCLLRHGTYGHWLVAERENSSNGND